MEFNELQYTKAPHNNVPFHTKFHELAGETKKMWVDLLQNHGCKASVPMVLISQDD